VAICSGSAICPGCAGIAGVTGSVIPRTGVDGDGCVGTSCSGLAVCPVTFKIPIMLTSVSASIFLFFIITFGLLACVFLRVDYGDDSIRGRIVCLRHMIFAPLILLILQNRELIRRQQRLDLPDAGHAVWLETGPDLLQLFSRGLDLLRAL